MVQSRIERSSIYTLKLTKMRLLLLLFVSIIFQGCANELLKLNRIYCYRPIYGVYKSIFINSNGKFTYYSKEGLNSDSISGRWTLLDNKHLSLSHTRDKNSVLYDIKTSNTKINGSNYINTRNIFGESLVGVSIVLNDTLGLVSNEQGIILLSEDTPINNIEVFYLNFPIPKYDLSIARRSSFEILINDEWKPSLSIKDSVIKLENNKIILDESEFLLCK